MLIAIAIAGRLLSQAAAPVPAANPPVAAPKPEKPKKPKLVCTEETATDSFISKRVCRTKDQIES